MAFERRVRWLGVAVIHSRPRHPKTLGKLERFQRTMKEWLADQPKAADDLAGLQQTLDRFRSHYNEERPHQTLGDLTPAERYRQHWIWGSYPPTSRSPTTHGERSFARSGTTG